MDRKQHKPPVAGDSLGGATISPAHLPTRSDPPALLTLPPDPAPPAETELMIGDELVGRYMLVEKLGKGGMGVVYRAYDSKDDRHVALKTLPTAMLGNVDARERFRREATLIKGIRDNSAVCHIYEYHEDGRVPFFTMELIEGQTLARMMHGERKPDVAGMFELLLQVANALEEVHRIGVVHRDLKPENVLVRPDGHAVLIDFGLAKQSEEQGGTSTSIIGTQRYMSPEQLQGGPLNPSTDVFSFGVMAFELLAGRAPFGSGAEAQVISAILRDRPVPFEQEKLSVEVVRALQSFFKRALAKDPKERFSSAGEMRVAFEDAWAGCTTGSTTEEISEPPSQPQVAPEGETEPLVAPQPLKQSSRLSEPRPWRNRKSVLPMIAAMTLLVSVGASVAFSLRDEPQRFMVSPLECDPLRSTVEVHPFKNATGDAGNDAFVAGLAGSLRGQLRTLRQLHVPDSTTLNAECPSKWVVEGTLRQMPDKMRISIEVHDMTKSALVPPIDVESTPNDAAGAMKAFKKAQHILLDDLRRQARQVDRIRRAHLGTQSAEARQYLLDYYRLVEQNRQPREEDRKQHMELITQALALDPDYPLALVEHAFLSAEGIGVENREEGTRRGLADLDRALVRAPRDPDVLVMRCRLMRLQSEIAGKPTDANIRNAVDACNEALAIDPESAELRIAFARIYDRKCKDDRALADYALIPSLDRRLAGDALRELIGIALVGNKISLAAERSLELLELEENSRDDVPAGSEAHLLRGAALMRMGKEYHAEAKKEFELEMARAHATPAERWAEASATRGWMILAKADGTTIPPAFVQRVATLEREAMAEAAVEPSLTNQIAIIYSWTDPMAALQWLERGGPPASFDDRLRRALFLIEAGRQDDARKVLADVHRKEQWEKDCYSVVSDRLK